MVFSTSHFHLQTVMCGIYTQKNILFNCIFNDNMVCFVADDIPSWNFSKWSYKFDLKTHSGIS